MLFLIFSLKTEGDSNSPNFLEVGPCTLHVKSDPDWITEQGIVSVPDSVDKLLLGFNFDRFGRYWVFC